MKHQSLHYICLLLGLFLNSMVLHAQQGSSALKGQVVDEYGSPIDAAQITGIIGTWGTSTTADGLFHLDPQWLGEAFTVEKEGFASQSARFDDPQSVTVRFTETRTTWIKSSIWDM